MPFLLRMKLRSPLWLGFRSPGRSRS